MDLESKISSLKNYAKLSTQDDRDVAHKHDYQESSTSSTEGNGWWGSISNKAQEPDPWLPGLVSRILHFTKNIIDEKKSYFSANCTSIHSQCVLSVL